MFLYFVSIRFQFLNDNRNPMGKYCLPNIFLHRISVEMKSFQSDYIVTLWKIPNELAHYTREITDRQLSMLSENPLGK